ncbi:MAG: DUF3048 domain-containing protein [Clostridia bacterium]|nr:DUF3048 domain-containing protein [Clostridia bacterium]
MYKKCLLFLITVFMSAAIVSCGSGGKKGNSGSPVPVNANQDHFTSSPTAGAATPTPVPVNSYSSGFVLPIEGIRPYAAMVDNEGTRPLPQGGLNKAQVVYEIIVEGGESRIMPVFWGTDPEMIGPVRSSRHYYLDYVLEHDAIYIHYGWSPRAMADIKKLGINNLNGVANGGEVFWDITKDRGNWQDSYTSMAKVKEYVNKVKYRTESKKKHVFTYNVSDSDLTNGKKAISIEMIYSSAYKCGYTYNPETKMYKRTRKGSPHMERMTGSQIEAKNIIIQNVKNSRIKGDTYDRQDLYNIGSGTGWLITNGNAVKIKWTKDARSEATRYVDENGSEIKLNPGQTWIQIVPASGIVKIQ